MPAPAASAPPAAKLNLKWPSEGAGSAPPPQSVAPRPAPPAQPKASAPAAQRPIPPVSQPNPAAEPPKQGPVIKIKRPSEGGGPTPPSPPGTGAPAAQPPSPPPSTASEVRLGVAMPAAVRRGEAFVARFAAYADRFRDDVVRVLRAESPSAGPRLDLQRCRWRRGATVTVRLSAEPAAVDNPVRTFEWDGAWEVLRFDVGVPRDANADVLVLRFDVAVEGLPLVSLRPEVALSSPAVRPAGATSDVRWEERGTPTSAFASYAREDRRDVLSRVRSLQIFADVDVFLDCLSVRPGDEWRAALEREIRSRDVFWLFWSRHARGSSWVEWEWRQALASKTLANIQPHPLEPADRAPPPPELSALQFGAQYEWYLSALHESWLRRQFRVVRYHVRSLLGRT